VCLLASIARSLRASRLAAGALALSSPEVKFLLDSETHDPLDVTSYVTRESNSTVEEFMLLANCAVAARITESFPRVALLRRHPAPPPSNFDALTAAARAAGITLNCASNKSLAESLDAAEAALATTTAAATAAASSHTPKLLRILATRCVMQATYFPSGTLPPPAYAH
jgi:exosome complex exonuclease DIS3/RRP44